MTFRCCVTMYVLQTCFKSLSFSLGDVSHPPTHRIAVLGHDCAADLGGGGGLCQYLMLGSTGCCQFRGSLQQTLSLHSPVAVSSSVAIRASPVERLCEPTAGGTPSLLLSDRLIRGAVTCDSMSQWNYCSRALNVAPVGWGGAAALLGWTEACCLGPLCVDLLAQSGT